MTSLLAPVIACHHWISIWAIAGVAPNAIAPVSANTFKFIAFIHILPAKSPAPYKRRVAATSLTA